MVRRAARSSARSDEPHLPLKSARAVETIAHPSRTESGCRRCKWGSADAGVDREDNLFHVASANVDSHWVWDLPEWLRVRAHRVDPRRKPDPIGAPLVRPSLSGKTRAREREDDVGGRSVTGDARSADRRDRPAPDGSVKSARRWSRRRACDAGETDSDQSQRPPWSHLSHIMLTCASVRECHPRSADGSLP